MRIAAIDIGTNSIHMVIAHAASRSGFEVVDRERDVVQIGRGSWKAGRLEASAIRRTAEALARYVVLAKRQQVDQIICTATAAVREAKNGGDFIQAAREASGIVPRVIPSEEEGRLIYLAVKSALELPAGPSLMIDIGGGSMQLVVGDRERWIETAGTPLGALRLTEEMLESDPPSRRDLQRLRRHIRRQSREALKRVAAHKIRQVYGSSGAIHALAQAAHWMETGQPLGQINGHWLATESLGRLTRRLQRMDLDARSRIPGIDARRAEIIVPGAMVLEHVLEEIEADGILLSDYGVREGLVTDYILSHPRELISLERGDNLRHRSVLQLLARFQVNEKHAQHVGRLALALFDGLRGEHRLGPDARELLNYAALLHDVGAVLGYDGHGEHSAYIIRNGNLRGFSGEEVEIIANAACYHGQKEPRKKALEEAGLGKEARQTVKWLAAILRVAEGLDRSHYQLVREVRVSRRGASVAILLTTKRDARLEIWAARRRTGLLERLLDRRVRIAERPAAEVPREERARAKAGAGAKAERSGAKPARGRGKSARVGRKPARITKPARTSVGPAPVGTRATRDEAKVARNGTKSARNGTKASRNGAKTSRNETTGLLVPTRGSGA